MLPFNKETMMMVALVAVIIACVYMYRELQKAKGELVDVKKRPQVVFQPPVAPLQKNIPAQPIKNKPENEEIKPDDTVADEQ
jgi:hypothetical protein